MNRHRKGCAEAVDGKTEMDARRGLLKSHQAGDFQFLVNVGIATEGYDDPRISCVAVARPTKSRALYTQMVGRGLRIAPRKNDCLILDFVGNSGRHKLACALDVLGGRYTEDEEEIAQEIIAKNPGMKAREALDQAKVLAEIEKQKQKEAARRAAIKAKAIYTKHTSNPFEVLHIDVRKDLEMAERFGGKVASEKQLACLGNMGMEVPAGCTSKLASKLIGTAFMRRKNGLASFKQLRILQRAGIANINISFQRANSIIDALAKNRWKPLPFTQLDSLLGSGNDRPATTPLPAPTAQGSLLDDAGDF
jgi:hypothetical protein